MENAKKIEEAISAYNNIVDEQLNTLMPRRRDLMMTPLKEYIDFPTEEYESLLKRINDNQIIYTTRVSSEVNKYFVNVVYNSPFGELKVIELKHFTNIKEHPFLNELSEAQVLEINKYINENGVDLIGLTKI